MRADHNPGGSRGRADRSASASVGDRVELVWTDDPYTDLKPGARGRVRLVDDMGTVHVDWDSGSTLGLVNGHDRWRVVEEDA
jgi:hypothetical protein